ncbi:uncharacterized protein LOC129579849 [Sitodiplosis mosellana]|uniref:uncharacterized protein LOC129579849 n=1 Tax=Sitodiplosis mosellana TaxID=263140 RepID=UPI002443C6DA|nr:uncharacterized protein LOC129579716 isoform X2 [Sitodiplosis mosellana]XP_055326002.1 uncharacterized protein LOC129579849 [Sitodiplosis mosellana]
MERSYTVSIKVLSENEPLNFRISVDQNNFDDFMTKIKNKVSLLTNENFRIYYTGKNGRKYCILDRDDFQQFVNEKVEDVLVEEIGRPALPALPAQPTPPAKMSCREFVYRAIGFFVPQSHHKID